MNHEEINKKFILLGASRGLGWATYKKLYASYPKATFLLVSRRILEKEESFLGQTQGFSFDFSKDCATDWNNFFEKIRIFSPTDIIYFAGGGPYGKFEDKKWSDHEWAFNVSFLAPAKVLHHCLSQLSDFSNLEIFTCIGSAIAESNPDKEASSYCAAKHALKGLVESVQLESKRRFKIKLFSPGYIETDLLPPNSWPREQGLAKSAENVAEDLLRSHLS